MATEHAPSVHTLPPLQRKPASVKPYYTYDILPPGWIRLLQILHEPDASPNERSRPLYVSMISVPLESCPQYVALSYTWGAPTWELHEKTEAFCQEPRCYPIHCGDRLLLGTRNLRDALSAIRFCQLVQYQRHEGQKFDFGGGVYNVGCYLWVDALSIDQTDLQERGHQVAQMGAIYRNSKSSLIWLGNEHSISRTISEFLQRVANNQRFLLLGSDVDGTGNLHKLREELVHELYSLDEDEAINLAVVFSNRYFSRLWIVQEAILAPEAAVMCGSLYMYFEVLLRVAQLLSLTDPLMFWIHTHKTATEKGLSLPKIGTDGSASEVVKVLTQIAHRRNPSELESASEAMHSFVSVIAMTSRSHATDPRDRIYGILSITRDLIRDSVPIIPVSYKLSVEEVYMSATVAVSTQSNRLNILYRASKPIDCEYTSLPSWCPDYSTPNTSRLVYTSGANSGWHTAKLWPVAPRIRFTGDSLFAEGFLYDTVAETAIDQNYSISRLLSIVANLKWSERPFPRNLRDSPAVGFVLPIICVGLMEMDFTKTHQPGLQRECRGLEKVIHRLVELEPDSALFLPRVVPPIGTGSEMTRYQFAEWMAEEASSIKVRAKSAGLESELEKLVPGSSVENLRNPTDASPSSEFFLSVSVHVLHILTVSVCVFSTKRTQHLALGPKRLKAGDEIWYLNGASGPGILRPRGNGTYQFVGMVYIEGLMYGEIADEPDNGRDTARVIAIK